MAKTAIYPDLGSVYDLGFVRIGGHGLGNCFYNYFHALALAEQHGVPLIAPPWETFRIGPFLRGERGKRLYWGLFRAHPDDISGPLKFVRLLSGYSRRNIIEIAGNQESSLKPGVLNVVKSRKFTFQGLHDSREAIRARLMSIIRDHGGFVPTWGSGGFIGVHVRLGDFSPVIDIEKVKSGASNVRIPISWYVDVVHALKRRYPDMPIRLFSDGHDSELQPLTDLGLTVVRSGSDIVDLLTMASASILVGSRSTYARWAVFLGNMPSVWVASRLAEEQPSSPSTPIAYVDVDAVSPELWPES